MDNINLNRENGQKLWAADWNKLVSTINQIIDAVNNKNNQPGITKLSQLINDSGFITQEDVKGKVNKGELAEVATSGSYNDLKDKPSQMTGPQGPEGKSAYQVAVQNGFIGTPQQWLNSLKGEPGQDGVIGQDGADGKSAYDLAVEQGYEGTLEQWLESLHGQDGTNGQNGQNGQDGITPSIDPTTKHWIIGSTDTGVLAEGQNGTNGTDGIDGTNGTTPHIDPITKHWMVGETDTNILAEGVDGQDGVTPHIDSTTGNWFIGNTDTGVRAHGFSGDYNDLSNKPTIPAAQIQADWNQTDNSALDYIKNKPDIVTQSELEESEEVIAAAITQLNENMPAPQIQADWNQDDSTALDYIKNKPSLATVATTGSYKDLNNSPGMFEANGHDYVEIAGIKWATMNLGANSVTDFGLYYQWGDTQGHTSAQVGNEEDQKYFGWEDYKYGNGTSDPGIAGMTKYNATDGLTILEESDDAIKAAWGGTWRLPTKEEFTTLYYNTNKSYQYDYQNSGVSGLLLTDKTDSNKQIFFPYAGHLSDGTFNENDGIYYWTNCLYSSYPTSAFYVQFYQNGNQMVSYGYKSRKFGYNIRGVLNDGLSNVAFTGRYKDLINKPVIPAAQIQANWNQTNNNAVDYIKNKPNLATVATSGSYRDLTKKPTIPEYTKLKKEIFITPTVLYPQNDEYNQRVFTFDFTGQHLYNPFKDLGGKQGYIKYFINNSESHIGILNEVTYRGGGLASYEEDRWTFHMGPYKSLDDYTYNIYIETDYNQEYLKNIEIYQKGDIKHSEQEGITPCYFIFGEAKFIIDSTVNNSFSLQPDWKEINRASTNYIKNKPGYTIANGHDYVEIGGIKWATMNVGANNVTDIGDLYFQWGDTQGYTADQVGNEEGKKYFGWDDYKFRANTNEFGFTKYGEIDGKLLLEDSDDAVTAAWGGNWRLPTKREIEILLDSVTFRSSIYGLYLVDKTDPNKELLFPYGGWVDTGNVEYNGVNDAKAQYMSKELHTETTWDGDSRYIDTFYIGSYAAALNCGERHLGYLIRGVLDDQNDFSTVAFTGDYNDLINKPTISASSGTSTQIQADWDQSDNTALDYIKNKPTIPTVPGNESASSGGNTLSVVTTGDKYNWNNKASIWSGTQAQYDALSPDYDSNTIYIITASS